MKTPRLRTYILIYRTNDARAKAIGGGGGRRRLFRKRTGRRPRRYTGRTPPRRAVIVRPTCDAQTVAALRPGTNRRRLAVATTNVPGLVPPAPAKRRREARRVPRASHPPPYRWSQPTQFVTKTPLSDLSRPLLLTARHVFLLFFLYL